RHAMAKGRTIHFMAGQFCPKAGRGSKTILPPHPVVSPLGLVWWSCKNRPESRIWGQRKRPVSQLAPLMPLSPDGNEQRMSEMIDFLLKRRSVAPVALTGPAPSESEIETMLRIASRVPDHGKLAPWRFIVFKGEARERAGAIVAEAFARKDPSADATRIAAEGKRMTMAPLIVAIVSTAGPHAKIPEWEQELSAGAVCMNLLIAAHAMGFAGSWLTNWFSYDRSVLTQFGLSESERIAGFMHIGRATTAPDDRPRPELATIVTEFGAAR
ncbi:MAG: hypothetical protein RL735_662, partial [Pseudomonadota bacterium]